MVIGDLLHQSVSSTQKRQEMAASQMKCGPKGYVFPWTTNGKGHWALSSITAISALEKMNYILFGPIINHRE